MSDQMVFVEDRAWRVLEGTEAYCSMCRSPRRNLAVAAPIRYERRQRARAFCVDHLAGLLRRVENGRVECQVLDGSPAARQGFTAVSG